MELKEVLGRIGYREEVTTFGLARYVTRKNLPRTICYHVMREMRKERLGRVESKVYL